MISKKQVLNAFKKRGLSLSPAALNAVLNLLSYGSGGNDNEEATSILNSLLDEIKDRLMDSSDSSLIVSRELLEQVVAGMTRDASDVMDEAMQLLDLNSGVPRLHYDLMKKGFSLLDSSSSSSSRSGGGGGTDSSGGFFGDAEDKVDMFLQRYALIYQRLMRQENFRPKLTTGVSYNAILSDDDNDDDDDDKDENDPSKKARGSNEQVKITPLEGLLGSKGTKILLGMIVQVEEGRYYLEDPTAQIPIDLSRADIYSGGFVTENSICLVEGEMQDGILVVERIGQPIYETRKDAIQAIGLQNSDLFGAIPTLSELSRLQQEEVRHGQDGMFVLLSDVYLDDPGVLTKLEKLFDGFQDFDPLPVFVFLGDFASRYPSAVEANANEIIMSYFDDLANVICKTPRIAKEGKFILVPGQNDPGIGVIMPRPQIPDYFTGGLRSKVKNVHLASNPCRLRFFSQEFVICRLDVLSKLRRECLMEPPVMVTGGENGKNHQGLESTSPLVQHAIKQFWIKGICVLSQWRLCQFIGIMIIC
jgi:DNA polymerase alpha/epsilon subunit B.